MAEDHPLPDQATPFVVARPIGAPPLAPSPPELELPYVRRSDALLDLTLVLLAAIVLPYAPSLLARVEEEGAAPLEIDWLVIFQVWCQAGLAIGLLLYFVLRHGFKPAAFGVRRDRISEQLLWGGGALIGVFLALLATAVFVLALYAIWPGVEQDLTRRFDYIDRMPVHHLGTTLALLVAVALNEEVVFRGLLLPYLRRVSGSWWWAVLISSLIFAVLHVPQQGVVGGLQILPIGLVLAIFFVLSRSLLAVTLAHLSFDFVQFQLIRVMPDLKELLERIQS
jgi:membrane protease YdiL (CAAX protease family)